MAKPTRNAFEQHLEFLGYAVDPANDSGWQLARHDRRWNIFVRFFEAGVRVFGQIVVGKSFGDDQLGFLEALNRANDEAAVARLSVIQDEDGDVVVRVRALFTGAYDRRAFGAFMDAWHDDTALSARLPALPQVAEPSGEDEDRPPAAKVLVS
jgi:hypothetical protein